MSVLTTQFALSRGSDLALADDTGTRTWAELDERVNRLIHSLRAAGINAGDTIAIISGNCNEWFEVALACSTAGIIYVPLNWHLVAAEIAYTLDDSGATAIICGHEFLAETIKALQDERTIAVGLALVIGGDDNDRLRNDRLREDDRLRKDDRFRDYDGFLMAGSPTEPTDQSFGGPMFYTSGTTGHPKGVRGSLASMPASTDAALWQLIGAGFGALVKGHGCTVLCGPVYHSAQWAYSFLPMIVGSATVMQRKYDSAGVLGLIDQYAATNVHLVPTQMKRLVDLPDDVKRSFDGSSLQLVIHGAAPCPPRVKQSMIDWWGPKISEYYGSTEGSVITMIDSQEWMAKGGSVGRALPNIEILVISDEGARCGPNESGTLYFRSALGSDFEYHNAPEKTAESHLEPGVFTTGDVGYLDDEGYLWLSDRKIDMVISGGVNIYPAEIEGVLGGHPLVADVAVIGVPNEEFGEEVKAVVVAADGVVVDDALRTALAAHCRELLAGFKVPRSFDFVAELPRTDSGKIQKAKIRLPYWEGHDRRI